MKYTLTDCCVGIAIVGEPALVLDDGDVDPFTGEEINWPYPRVYWSNGTITDGAFFPLDEDD